MNSTLYRLLHGTVRAISLLPFPVLYVLSDMAFFPVYYLVRYRRQVVRRNLRNSFPEKPLHEIRSIERKFYHFFCDYIVETLKLLSIRPGQMRRHMQMIGTEIIKQALRDHDFCFVYLGHYGNWEYVATLPLWVSEQAHCAQLYHPLRNAYADKLFYELRSRFGGENIAKNDTLRRLLALRQEGKKTIVGFISDQAPRRVNIHDWVQFLSQDTPVFTGGERLGKRLDAAFVYCDMERTARGYYRGTFRLMTDQPKEHPDYALTETYMRLLEESIRRNPHLWLWSHNRWKRQRQPEDAPKEVKG